MSKSSSSSSSSSYKILHGSCSSPESVSSPLSALCPMNSPYILMADNITSKPPSIAANIFQLSKTAVIPLNSHSANGQRTATDSHKINCRMKMFPFLSSFSFFSRSFPPSSPCSFHTFSSALPCISLFPLFLFIFSLLFLLPIIPSLHASLLRKNFFLLPQ